MTEHHNRDGDKGVGSVHEVGKERTGSRIFKMTGEKGKNYSETCISRTSFIKPTPAKFQ